MQDIKEYTPRQIVKELDKYIIGQAKAKKSVAIALRNRWRRLQVPEDLRDEIYPNNIILIGPTGVGKTEISRRLARLANAPFIKIEASKFTEVGYVGRDVESIIRDLADLAVSMLKTEKTADVQEQAHKHAEARILELLLPPPPKTRRRSDPDSEKEQESEERYLRNREKLKRKLLNNELEDRTIELDVTSDQFPSMQIISPMGVEEMGVNLQDLFGGMIPKKSKRRKMKISQARKYLVQEEAQKLIDMEQIIQESIERVENSGIVFLDEIDKIAGESAKSGPDVSREGVQRDLLPVVEGTSVFTKYGMVKTDHILFIASGAFTVSKPSDLIPELQGRFPIRVELSSLTSEDFVRILSEPETSLTKQYTALLKTEGVTLKFTAGAIQEVAKIASDVNSRTENIGARRLHTVLTALLEDYLFEVPDMDIKQLVITKEMVKESLSEIAGDEDLSRYIL